MRPHIMIVDDTPDHLLLMRRIFKMVDPTLQIITSASGDEALHALRSAPRGLPKVILLDLRMPGKSGQEVLSELKSDPSLRAIPVCAFSNGDVQSDICECYERGASFYFKKPAGLDDLKKFADAFNTIWFQVASHCG